VLLRRLRHQQQPWQQQPRTLPVLLLLRCGQHMPGLLRQPALVLC
jgi:hypothetical protein